MLLLDRGFDLISPVIHDFFYQSLVNEFNDVGEEGEITLANNSKMAFLNDQDDLWVRFRNKHIAEVHATLNHEVSSVAAESKKKAGKSTDEMSL
jgi:syntaxin-binding protein 1